MKKLLLLLFILTVSETFSQTLSVFELDTNSYPGIKSKFYAFDSSGALIKSLSASDFRVTENESAAAIKRFTSPNSTGNQAYSVCIAFDGSESMRMGGMTEIPIVNAQRSAARLTDSSMMPPSQFALQLYTGREGIKILQDFSSDKVRTINLINSIYTYGNKNIPDQLLNPESGLLNLVKTGKNKRIALFMTDGRDIPLTNEIITACIDTCKKYNITFYAIAFTRKNVDPDGVKVSLWKIASQTGGLFIDGMASLEASYELARTLSFIFKGYEANTIEWQTVTQCQSKLIDVEISYLKNNSKTRVQYRIAPESLPLLEFEPSSVVYRNYKVGFRHDTAITVRARNADFNVSNIISSNSIYNISPKSFILAKNQSKQLVISYTPVDSSSTSTEFDFVTNQCNRQYNTGGTYYKNPGLHTLKLISPNGGEIYGIGADTLIRWEGIPARDTVRLEYSKDSGDTWILITDKASGLSYRWEGLPSPEGDKYMIRIKQLSPTGLDTIPSIKWQKCFGGSVDDFGDCVTPTEDSGFIISGSYMWEDGDFTGNHNLDYSDICLFKIDSVANIEWQISLGGSEFENSPSFKRTSDGGYILAANTSSKDGDVSGNKGRYDIWVVKLDSNRIIEWQRCFGGWRNEGSFDRGYYSSVGIELAGKNNYYVSSTVESSDGDIIGNHGYTDIWVTKLDLSGNIIWQKALGGKGWESGYTLVATNDGGCLVAGKANTIDGDVNGIHGGYDYWIIKLDANGSIQWKKTYGGSLDDIPLTAKQTKDGGYIIGGISKSNDEDISNHKGETWTFDAWIIKLNSSGVIEWEKSYGGANKDTPYTIIESQKGGFVIGGYTNSSDGDIKQHIGNNNNEDCWIFKIDEAGNSLWHLTFGGSDIDAIYSLAETNDNGFIVAGKTLSSDKDIVGKKGYKGYWDALVVKLNYDKSVIQSDTSDNVFSIIKPQMESFDIDFGKALVDGFKDSIITGFVKNTGSVKFRVDSIYFRGEGASYFSIINTAPPFDIEPSSAADIIIRYQPEVSGYHDVEIVVITQSDTLVQWVWAQGIPPFLSVLDKKIDFGNVFVGIAKEAKGTVTVKNVTKDPLAIQDTRRDNQGNPDFSILGGGGKFTLKSGDTCRLDLRFLPSKPGRANGYVEFHYNGFGSPAVIELIGRGVDTKPEIEISGSVRFCENEDLTLTTTEEFLNYKWSTGDKARSINIHEPGTYSVSGEYASGKWNQSDNYYAIRTENVYETEPLTGTSEIDFGEVPTGELICREFSIKNRRTFDVLLSEINLINNIDFSVPLSQFPTLLNPGKELKIRLCFRAINPGDMTDSLYIIDSCYDHKLYLTASAYGEAINPLYGGSLSVRKVIENNTGSTELVIFEPYPNPVLDKSFITLITRVVQNANIELYDNLGNSSAHIYDGEIIPGVLNEFEIDALSLSSGVYYILISGDDFIESVPIVVLK